MALGFKITKWNPKAVMTPATAINLRAMTAAALLLERNIKIDLSKKGTGRQYGKHQASAPGKPPAPDTGILRSSMIHEIEKSRDVIDGYVGVERSVEYALYMELGTKNIVPRPYLRPAITRNRKKILDIFKRANK